MKKSLLFRLFALVAAMMCALGASAAEAYANYTPSNTTLTFYYDNLRSTRPGTTYDLNTGGSYPGWYTDHLNVVITNVVFDSSFAAVRPTTTYCWFASMTQLQSITGMKQYLNTSSATVMSFMFSNCSALTSLDVSGFNTANVGYMVEMFSGCSNLEGLDLSSFNTDKVINMTKMFYNCKKLSNLDLSSFNTENAIYMNSMFYFCSELTSLNLVGFNTAKVTDMGNMFYRCSNLTTIYVSTDWRTTKVTSSTNMFYNCTSLVGGQGTTYDPDHVNWLYARIDGGTAKPGYLTAFLTLDDALNYEDGNIHFNSTGVYPWTVLSEGDRIFAQSSNAGIPSSTSTLTATVTVDKATTLSFEYKAWGEGADLGVEGVHYDECKFSIDGVEQFACGKRDNDWEVYTVELPAGYHTLEWSYTKDSSVNPVGDYFAVDNVVVGRPLLSKLDRALNIEGGELHFATTGDYPWTVLTEGDRLYAQSTNAGVASSTSTLTAEVTTAHGATLSFEYKAWGEGSSYDKCIFSVDGVEQFAYGAIKNDWEVYTVELTAGTHALEWSYTKDSSVNPEGDYFAVDNVALEEASGLRGDVDGNGVVGMDDLTALINYLVYGTSVNMTGADTDLSGGVGMDDLTTLINYLVYGHW